MENKYDEITSMAERKVLKDALIFAVATMMSPDPDRCRSVYAYQKGVESALKTMKKSFKDSLDEEGFDENGGKALYV